MSLDLFTALPLPRTRITYPSDFETFWSSYPTDANMSKAETLPEWRKLGEADRQNAIASLPAFKANCAKNPERRVIYAVRYLKYRRFDAYAEAAEKVATRQDAGVWVAWDSPAGKAWAARYRSQGRMPPRDFKGGWHHPTEFPA